MAENLELGVSFLNALGSKDLAKFSQYIDPEVSFIHPFMKLSGKEAYLKHIEKVMPLFTAVKIHDKFESGDKVAIVHEIDCPPPVGNFRVVVLLTFRNKLITRIELFFDPKPLESIKNKIS